MRKKPDILFLLAILVIPGVIISNLVIIKDTNKTTTKLSQLNAQYSQVQTVYDRSGSIQGKTTARELVRIDLSKQQIR